MADEPKVDVKQLYDDAVDYLDENFAFFLTHILNLGSPEWAPGLGTCAVALEKDYYGKKDKQFKFLMDPDYISQFDAQGVAFLAGHEAMHIALDHLTLLPKFPEKQLANLAADLVIEDYLDESGLTPVDDKLRGEKWLGYSCAYLPVSYVYEELENLRKNDPDKFEQLKAETGEGGEGCQGHNHDWIHDPEGLQAAVAQEMIKDQDVPADLQDVKDDQHANGLLAGKSAYDVQTNVTDAGISLKWADLLKEVNPDMFKTPGLGPPMLGNFRKQPKKLMSMYPELPMLNYERDEFWTSKTDEIPSIVMALDVSGSISSHDRDRFVTLGKSIPKERIHLRVCTFNTNYREVDTDTWRIHSGGGTSFDAIEAFIQEKVMPENKGRYPKAVVVMTDGQSSFYKNPDKANQDSWFWLLIGGGGYYGHYKPENFVKQFFGRAEDVDKFVTGR